MNSSMNFSLTVGVTIQRVCEHHVEHLLSNMRQHSHNAVIV